MRDPFFQENINLIKTEFIEAMKEEKMAIVQEVRDGNTTILQVFLAIPLPTVN